jgi:hypothetical protein
MLFITDMQRLRGAIRITRDDRTAVDRGKDGPFYRIEASGDRIRLTGKEVEAEFPATVYEPGVLFLRVTLFRWALADIRDQPMIAVQVNAAGVHVDNVCLPLESNDMLLYADPTRAPQRYPMERLGPLAAVEFPDGPASWGPLFEVAGLRPDLLRQSSL